WGLNAPDILPRWRTHARGRERDLAGGGKPALWRLEPDPELPTPARRPAARADQRGREGLPRRDGVPHAARLPCGARAGATREPPYCPRGRTRLRRDPRGPCLPRRFARHPPG